MSSYWIVTKPDGALNPAFGRVDLRLGGCCIQQVRAVDLHNIHSSHDLVIQADGLAIELFNHLREISRLSFDEQGLQYCWPWFEAGSWALLKAGIDPVRLSILFGPIEKIYSKKLLTPIVREGPCEKRSPNSMDWGDAFFLAFGAAEEEGYFSAFADWSSQPQEKLKGLFLSAGVAMSTGFNAFEKGLAACTMLKEGIRKFPSNRAEFKELISAYPLDWDVDQQLQFLFSRWGCRPFHHLPFYVNKKTEWRDWKEQVMAPHVQVFDTRPASGFSHSRRVDEAIIYWPMYESCEDRSLAIARGSVRNADICHSTGKIVALGKENGLLKILPPSGVLHPHWDDFQQDGILMESQLKCLDSSGVFHGRVIRWINNQAVSWSLTLDESLNKLGYGATVAGSRAGESNRLELPVRDAIENEVNQENQALHLDLTALLSCAELSWAWRESKEGRPEFYVRGEIAFKAFESLDLLEGCITLDDFSDIQLRYRVYVSTQDLASKVISNSDVTEFPSSAISVASISIPLSIEVFSQFREGLGLSQYASNAGELFASLNIEINESQKIVPSLQVDFKSLILKAVIRALNGAEFSTEKTIMPNKTIALLRSGDGS